MTAPTATTMANRDFFDANILVYAHYSQATIIRRTPIYFPRLLCCEPLRLSLQFEHLAPPEHCSQYGPFCSSVAGHGISISFLKI